MEPIDDEPIEEPSIQQDEQSSSENKNSKTPPTRLPKLRKKLLLKLPEGNAGRGIFGVKDETQILSLICIFGSGMAGNHLSVFSTAVAQFISYQQRGWNKNYQFCRTVCRWWRQWQSSCWSCSPLRRSPTLPGIWFWVVSVQRDIGIINGKKKNRAQQCTSSNGILCSAGSTGWISSGICSGQDQLALGCPAGQCRCFTGIFLICLFDQKDKRNEETKDSKEVYQCKILRLETPMETSMQEGIRFDLMELSSDSVSALDLDCANNGIVLQRWGCCLLSSSGWLPRVSGGGNHDYQ